MGKPSAIQKFQLPSSNWDTAIFVQKLQIPSWKLTYPILRWKSSSQLERWWAVSSTIQITLVGVWGEFSVRLESFIFLETGNFSGAPKDLTGVFSWLNQASLFLYWQKVAATFLEEKHPLWKVNGDLFQCRCLIHPWREEITQIETNIAPHKWWLGDDPFLLGYLFSNANSLWVWATNLTPLVLFNPKIQQNNGNNNRVLPILLFHRQPFSLPPKTKVYPSFLSITTTRPLV